MDLILDLGTELGPAGSSWEDRGGPPPSFAGQGVPKIGLDSDTGFGGPEA